MRDEARGLLHLMGMGSPMMFTNGGTPIEAEHRCAPRFSTNSAGRLLPGKAGDHLAWRRSTPMVACDISATGLLLASSHRPAEPLQVGAVVSAKFIAGGDALELEGRVRWVHDAEEAWICGIEVDPDAQPFEARVAWEHWHSVAAGLALIED